LINFWPCDFKRLGVSFYIVEHDGIDAPPHTCHRICDGISVDVTQKLLSLDFRPHPYSKLQSVRIPKIPESV